MLRISPLVQGLSTALRPVGYLVRDLAPWLIRGAIGWVIDRIGAGSAGGRPLCRTCPFQPPGAPAPVEPRRTAAAKRPSIVPPAVLLPFLLLAFAAGCAPPSSYVAADRATFDAIAPEYAGYVEADPRLDPAAKARRSRTLATWRFRLEQAEAR